MQSQTATTPRPVLPPGPVQDPAAQLPGTPNNPIVLSGPTPPSAAGRGRGKVQNPAVPMPGGKGRGAPFTAAQNLIMKTLDSSDSSNSSRSDSATNEVFPVEKEEDETMADASEVNITNEDHINMQLSKESSPGLSDSQNLNLSGLRLDESQSLSQSQAMVTSRESTPMPEEDGEQIMKRYEDSTRNKMDVPEDYVDLGDQNVTSPTSSILSEGDPRCSTPGASSKTPDEAGFKTPDGAGFNPEYEPRSYLYKEGVNEKPMMQWLAETHAKGAGARMGSNLAAAGFNEHKRQKYSRLIYVGTDSTDSSTTGSSVSSSVSTDSSLPSLVSVTDTNDSGLERSAHGLSDPGHDQDHENIADNPDEQEPASKEEEEDPQAGDTAQVYDPEEPTDPDWDDRLQSKGEVIEKVNKRLSILTTAILTLLYRNRTLLLSDLYGQTCALSAQPRHCSRRLGLLVM